MLIALRLAERAVIAERAGEAPLLLVDDLSNELDSQRSRRVVETVAALSGQAFLTGTEPRTGLAGSRTFIVRSGRVFEDSSAAGLERPRLLGSASA